MVVSYLNLINAVVMPFKANAPLMVNPNTVLSFPFSLQGFQAVCRWDTKVVKGASPMDHNQFPFSELLNVLRQFAEKTAVKNLFGLLAFERLNHKNYTNP
jgi:hypothetical protein